MEKRSLFLLPVPAEGHLVSMVDMASRLLRRSDNLSVTVLLITVPIPGFAFAPEQTIKSAAASGLDIRFEELPPGEPSSHPPIRHEPCSGAAISEVVSIHKAHVKAALSRGAGTVSALVLDFLATTMIDVADEVGIPVYVYFASGAATLALMLNMPTLHEKKRLPIDLGHAKEPIDVPGMPPVPPFHMPMSVLSHRVDSYTSFLSHGRRYRETKGLIVNTFAELELPVLSAIEEGRCVPDHPTPPLYAVGPVIRLGGHNEAKVERHECIKWLDRQAPASVVFMCFGSAGSLSSTQMKEAAAALERSGHRFLWAARVSSRAAKHQTTPLPNLEELLPEGFLKRTKGRGLIWPAPVPQVEILAHEAVGGFVTHCGWNSSLESLWFGVPMLAWPLYAEQHFIAFRLVRDFGVAVGLKVDRRNGNYVSATELEAGIRCLMWDSGEGQKVRRRAQEMKVASRKAVEQGGSSFSSLERLARELLAVYN